MPTMNAKGEVIYEAKLTTKEVIKNDYLKTLTLPDKEDVIFHLGPTDFRRWLYLQNPREALLLCSTQGIKEKIAHQAKKWRWSIISDFFWRLIH